MWVWHTQILWKTFVGGSKITKVVNVFNLPHKFSVIQYLSCKLVNNLDINHT